MFLLAPPMDTVILRPTHSICWPAPEGQHIIEYISYLPMPQYVNMLTCNQLQKINTFPSIYPTHTCLKMLTCHVTGFRRLTYCPVCSPPIHVSICPPVDLSPVSKPRHIAEHALYWYIYILDRCMHRKRKWIHTPVVYLHPITDLELYVSGEEF